MRYFIYALLLTAAACAEQSNSAPSSAASEQEPVQNSASSNFDKTAALSLVREFSGDDDASVSITKVSGDGVCGTAVIEGQSIRFYADLVDEEAFIEKRFPGAEAIISAAC